MMRSIDQKLLGSLGRKDSAKDVCTESDQASPRVLRVLRECNRLTVFYHRGCPDGVTGAWACFSALPDACQKKLGAMGGIFSSTPDVKLPHKPTAQEQLEAGGPVFEAFAPYDRKIDMRLVDGRSVVFIDATPTADLMNDIARAAASVVILDHHRGALGTILAAFEFEQKRQAAAKIRERRRRKIRIVFDEARSGSQIAWDWAHPGSPRPLVVDYVGDHDLQPERRLASSREINKALQSEGIVYRIGSIGAVSTQSSLQSFGERGELYLRAEDEEVLRYAKRALPGTIKILMPGEEQPRIYSAVATHSFRLQTEIGAALLKAADPDTQIALVWRRKRGCGVVVSMRTDRPGVDLSAIAACLGKGTGGGHARAAAFATTEEEMAQILGLTELPTK